jgi:hypothetical protein
VISLPRLGRIAPSLRVARSDEPQPSALTAGIKEFIGNSVCRGGHTGASGIISPTLSSLQTESGVPTLARTVGINSPTVVDVASLYRSWEIRCAGRAVAFYAFYTNHLYRHLYSHVYTILHEWTTHYIRGRPHSALGPGLPEPLSDQVAPNEHQHSLPCRITGCEEIRAWRLAS